MKKFNNFRRAVSMIDGALVAEGGDITAATLERIVAGELTTAAEAADYINKCANVAIEEETGDWSWLVRLLINTREPAGTAERAITRHVDIHAIAMSLGETPTSAKQHKALHLGLTVGAAGLAG